MQWADLPTPTEAMASSGASTSTPTRKIPSRAAKTKAMSKVLKRTTPSNATRRKIKEIENPYDDPNNNIVDLTHDSRPTREWIAELVAKRVERLTSMFEDPKFSHQRTNIKVMLELYKSGKTPKPDWWLIDGKLLDRLPLSKDMPAGTFYWETLVDFQRMLSAAPKRKGGAENPSKDPIETEKPSKPTAEVASRVSTLNTMLKSAYYSNQHSNIKAALALYESGRTPQPVWRFLDGKLIDAKQVPRSWTNEKPLFKEYLGQYQISMHAISH